jgi:hypothetical protein
MRVQGNPHGAFRALAGQIDALASKSNLEIERIALGLDFL